MIYWCILLFAYLFLLIIYFFFRFDHEITIKLDWASQARIPEGKYHLRDLQGRENLDTISVGEHFWQSSVSKHETLAFKLSTVVETKEAG